MIMIWLLYDFDILFYIFSKKTDLIWLWIMIWFHLWYVRYVRLPIVEGMADQNAQPILLKTTDAGPKTVDPCYRVAVHTLCLSGYGHPVAGFRTSHIRLQSTISTSARCFKLPSVATGFSGAWDMVTWHVTTSLYIEWTISRFPRFER